MCFRTLIADCRCCRIALTTLLTTLEGFVSRRIVRRRAALLFNNPIEWLEYSCFP